MSLVPAHSCGSDTTRRHYTTVWQQTNNQWRIVREKYKDLHEPIRRNRTNRPVFGLRHLALAITWQLFQDFLSHVRLEPILMPTTPML